jgi:amino acid transporter
MLAVLGAALLAFYSFVGFETSANLAEEFETFEGFTLARYLPHC